MTKWFIGFLIVSQSALADEVLLLGDKRSTGSGPVWIEKSQILKGEVGPKGAQVRALNEGRSLLKDSHQLTAIEVLHPNKMNLWKALQKHLQKSLGLKVSVANGDVLVGGQLFRWEDILPLRDLAIQEQAPFVLQAKLSPDLTTEFSTKMNEILTAEGLPKQNFTFSRGIKIYVPQQNSELKELLGNYGVQMVIDKSHLQMEPTIKVNITVAEVRRELSRKWGLQWPGSIQGKILPSGSHELSSLDFAANFLENSGMGKVLASPNIICRSGEEAEFLAGGEFPIKILNFKVQDVIWKKYGILLKVKPRADRSGKMSLQISTEVSTIDNSRTVDGVPGLLTNKISSQFDLLKSQVIALSGLIKNEKGSSSQGLPGLSQIPILGALFSSKEFKENRTELVVLVQPQILDDNQLSPPTLPSSEELQ